MTRAPGFLDELLGPLFAPRGPSKHVREERKREASARGKAKRLIAKHPALNITVERESYSDGAFGYWVEHTLEPDPIDGDGHYCANWQHVLRSVRHVIAEAPA
tara:strand:+ start:209 stop:517 length:309 start_codon:yes stop_codon:yes gene_type:complete